MKGIVFSSTLTTDRLASVFRDATRSTRGLNAKLIEAVNKVEGGNAYNFYTPTFDSPFGAGGGAPDFAIGLNIAKVGGYGSGNGATPIHMYVDDAGDHRVVQLVSDHNFMGGARASRLLRKIYEAFHAADPKLTVTDGDVL